MQRIVIHQPGAYHRLVVEEAPDPSPGPGEVLIDVEAVGINFADCIIRMGLYASAKQYVGYPITPGFEAAGRIAAVGEGVEAALVGTPVFALTLFGGYATKLILPRHQVFPIPQAWSAVQAAGFPTAFLTAWFALAELARPRTGETVLVHSAAGGVGSAAVQLAKLMGCRVVAVVGAAHKCAAARACGADEIIDKSRSVLWAEAERLAPDGYDAILDANGAATLRQSYVHLAAGGKLVVYGFHTMFRKGLGRPPWFKLAWDWLRTPRFNPLKLTQENRSVLGFNLSFLSHRAVLLTVAMEQLLGHAEAGRLRPLPTRTYPFEDVAAAHRDLESGESVGKLVLVTDIESSGRAF